MEQETHGNNKLKIFDERDVLGKQFRIFGDVENPLFLARDVAEWIEYDTNSVGQMLEVVDESENLTCSINRSGQLREMWFLTEDGLYEVCMSSHKPIAKQFKKKVKEILRDIRKYGMYMTGEKIYELLSKPENIAEILLEYAEEKKMRIKLQKENEILQNTIEIQHPKVNFAEAVEDSDILLLVRDIAKILKQSGIDIGGNRLLKEMRNDGFLIDEKYSDRNRATQKSMNMKLFRFTEWFSDDGKVM